MATAQLGSVFRRIGRLFGSGSVIGLSEAQLLARFVESRDESAFEALVARYGPMVLGVCRQMLDDPHAADDAFQATFLVLVRRAGSIRDGDLLGNWLYGVALKVAKRSRADRAKRKAREGGSSAMTAEPAGDDPGLDRLDVPIALHEELAKLPDKYRAPMVLCFLDGRTCEEAAERLGWPVGTVKGRIARAKEMLRGRLARRGVTASTALVAATMTKAARASVPPALLDQTVKAAMGLAAGGATVAAGLGSAAAVALADGVSTTMMISKMKMIAAAAALAVTLATGAGVMAQRGLGGGGQEPKRDAPKAEGSGSEGQQPPGGEKTADGETTPRVPYLELVKAAPAIGPLDPAQLLVQRVTAAKELLDAAAAFYESGTVTFDRLVQAATYYRDARLETTAQNSEAADKIREDHVKFLGLILKREKAKYQVGTASLPNMAEANYAYVDAQVKLALARENAPKPPSFVGGGGAVGGGGFGGGGGAVAASPDPEARESDDPDRDEKINAALDQVISMPFARETPLEDVIKYIQTATIGEGIDHGIPIYVDPGGLQDAERTMASPITLSMENVKLKTTLRLMLRQLDLGYYVKDGLLYITAARSPEFKDETQPGWRERERAQEEADKKAGRTGGFR